MLYQLYGIVISDDELLPAVAPSIKGKADVRVRHFSNPKDLFPPSHWFMQWHLPGGNLWLSFAKMDGGYLLRFNELVDFFVSGCGDEVVCMTKPGIPTETIQHLLLNQVIPLLINLRGGQALHTSAVLIPQGVIAFSGPAGSGKSTLAGSFLNGGYPLMTDDCLALIEKNDDFYGIPAYPGLRLWEDASGYLFGDNGTHKLVAHYTNKRRVEIETTTRTHCTEPRPLKRLYTIADSSTAENKTDILIQRLSPRDGFMTLVRCAFRLDITDRKMMTRQFRFLERVVSAVPVHRLFFPRDFKLLPAVQEAILRDLKDLKN